MKDKSLLITLLLLIFLGQTVSASVIPCQMDMTSHNMTQQIDDSIDHSAHNMPAEAANCELDCQCPMASCVSVLITSVDSSSPEQQPSMKFLMLTSQHITQRLTSLYRPPITR